MTAGRTINSQSTNWCTPEKYIIAIKEVLNEIYLDPCSNKYSIVKAKTEYILPMDGLKESWNFPTIYVNPPYGRNKENKTSISNWIEKCLLAYQNGSEVIALIPVATNTGHWKKYIWNNAKYICFLYDTRLKFLIDGLQQGKGAPMSCCMVYWGNRDKFKDVFFKYGKVINL